MNLLLLLATAGSLMTGSVYAQHPRTGAGNMGMEDTLRLWYATPASDWMTEALPVGNGYIGAMFFGGVDTEHIQFSEGSLWSGGPGSNPAYNYGTRDNAFQSLATVRKLLDEQKFREADSLATMALTGANLYCSFPGRKSLYHFSQWK